MVSLKELYYTVAGVVKGICDKTYYRDRPKSVDEKIGSYLVVSFPSAIVNRELDPRGGYADYTTTLFLEVYVRDKQSAANLNAPDIKTMDEKVRAVMEKLPLSTDGMLVTRPEVVMDGNDESGFHVTLIRAKVRTK